MKRQFSNGKYRISILTERLIRFEYDEEGRFVDSQTQLVLNRDFQKTVDFRVKDEEGMLEIHTPYLSLYYDKQPFSTKGLYIQLAGNYTTYGSRWYYGEEYETLPGTCQTLDQVDGGTELGKSILSKTGFATLEDSDTSLLLDDGSLQPKGHDSQDFYFFGYGRDYEEALQDYFQLTGYPPLLPRFALGNWWSRFWRYTEESYLSLVNTFQAHKIPLSVAVIDMDWHVTDVPAKYGTGWTGYTWNKKLFSDPERFMKRLHEEGLKVSLNVHPADGVRAFEAAYPAVAEAMHLNTELEEVAQFDLMNEEFRAAYFGILHRQLEKEGVDFWWIDWQQGTKNKMATIDPLLLLNHYHYLDNQKQTGSGLILSRYAGPGSHRYPLGFSGDTYITWESLEFQPYFTNSASNIGYTWWSHDIGGHMGGSKDEELLLRWLQFGVFSPVNRLHSSCSAFTSKEPWMLSKTGEEIASTWLRFRHQLLPYLYTMNVLTHEKGQALLRPMYYLYPNEEASYHVPNQYFFGDQLMVAPITEHTDATYQSAKVKVWFPKGIWYDFFTDVAYKGDIEMPIFRKKDTMPVFAKAGAIIPMDADGCKFGVDLPAAMTWHIFPGPSNQFQLVEDDGDRRVVTSLEVDWENALVKLRLAGDLSILPENRTHQLIFHATGMETVLLTNEQQEFTLDKCHQRPSTEQEWLERTFNELNRYEISYDLKDQIWHLLQTETDSLKLQAYLNTLDPDLRERLFEFIYTKEVS